MFMYADDTLLLCQDKDINEVTVKAQKALTKLTTWCEANKLTINFGKTKYMIVKHVKLVNLNPLDPKESTSNMQYFPRISQNSLKIPPNF